MKHENAMKFIPVWIEAFIIFAITWTFGSILNDLAKKDLDSKIKDKIASCKSDLMTYQKLQKKK